MSSDAIAKSVSGASEYTSRRTCGAVARNARSRGNHRGAASGAGMPADAAPESERTCACCHVPMYSKSPPRARAVAGDTRYARSEEHTSELQSRFDLVCRLLLEKKKKKQ